MHFLTDVTMQIQADVEHGHARVDRKSESRTKRVEATTDRPICAVFVYKNRSRGWHNISVDEKLRFYEILTVRSHEGETTRELLWRAKKAMGNCYEHKGFGDRQRLEWGQRLFETLCEWSVESCRCSLLVSYSISSDRPLQRVLRGGGVGGYLPLLGPGTCRLR